MQYLHWTKVLNTKTCVVFLSSDNVFEVTQQLAHQIVA